MVLLIDANVILNYLLNREPFFNNSFRLIDDCRNGKVDAYIAFHTVSIIWYALRKMPVSERRPILLDICELMAVVSASHQKVLQAIMEDDFPDFEDCLQEKCAETVHADYIVTENKKDFSASKIPAVTSAEMIDILHRSNISNES